MIAKGEVANWQHPKRNKNSSTNNFNSEKVRNVKIKKKLIIINTEV